MVLTPAKKNYQRRAGVDFASTSLGWPKPWMGRGQLPPLPAAQGSAQPYRHGVLQRSTFN